MLQKPQASSSFYRNAFRWTIWDSLIVRCSVSAKQTCLYVRQLNWLSSLLLEDVLLNGAMKTVSDFIIVSISPFGIPLCFHAVFGGFFFGFFFLMEVH